MLLSLSIRDLVLIDAQHLTVESGLTVLTGETGAGKSILLDALGLALGRRGDISLIRQGADQAAVSAEFCVRNNPTIQRLLVEHGLADSEGGAASSVVFRRILSRRGNSLEGPSDNLPAVSAGRSRAFINDQIVSIGLLRLFGDSLLEIHGQFDRLLDPASYRLLLDEFAKSQEERHRVSQTYGIWHEAQQKWQQAESHLTDLRQNEEFIKQQLKDLKKLNPLPGEEEELLKERESLAHVGKLSEAVREVKRHLQAPSLETALHSAIKPLQRVQGQGGVNIDAAQAALERALTEVIEAQAQIQEVADRLANHPQRLQEIDERLYALRTAARKHGTTGEGLAAFQESLVKQLDSLEQAGELLDEHARITAVARCAYHIAAQTLHDIRQKSADALEKAVMAELPALKLPHSEFSVQVTVLPEKQWTESGLDRIDFMVAMNKGQEPCSLNKSASGGELARLMLALKVALASQSSLPAIIFDEIDTGVGGAVAAAIGERLATLSSHVQVLAITHSPQLAACAHHHLLVFKEEQETSVRTSVRSLTSSERQDELARMLSGAEITLEARAAAGRLLSHAG